MAGNLSQFKQLLDSVVSLSRDERDRLVEEARKEMDLARERHDALLKILSISPQGPRPRPASASKPRRPAVRKPAGGAGPASKPLKKRPRKPPKPLAEQDLQDVLRAIGEQGLDTKRALFIQFGGRFGIGQAGRDRLDMHLRRLSRDGKIYFTGRGDTGRWHKKA